MAQDAVLIVIPLYSTDLAPSERLSLSQCFAVLKSYPKVLVVPQGLDLDELALHLPENVGIETFPPEFFEGREGYNRLLLSPDLYDRFRDHDYLLIHQLDVFVFRDELQQWVAKGYDYVGAPSFIQKEDDPGKLENWTTGNGGLSLRKVSSMLRVLKSRKNFFATGDYREKMKAKGDPWLLREVKTVFKSLGFRNKMPWILKHFKDNEDVFWSFHASKMDPSFRKAPVEEARKFALEKYPSALWHEEKGLPFGVHAWEKYDPAFWAPLIEKHTVGKGSVI